MQSNLSSFNIQSENMVYTLHIFIIRLNKHIGIIIEVHKTINSIVKNASLWWRSKDQYV